MNTARRLKLRPSSPEKQAEKNGKIRSAAGRRVAHKAVLAEMKATEVEMSAEELREKEATFRSWLRTYYSDAEELLGDGFDRFVSAARGYVMGTIDHETWREVLAAYKLAWAAAHPPKYDEQKWRRMSLDSSRPDGW
jgi:hypothetical protein